jgi:hypothetical protein
VRFTGADGGVWVYTYTTSTSLVVYVPDAFAGVAVKYQPGIVAGVVV